MLIEIALQRTFNYVDKHNNEIHENWNSTNIDEATVYVFDSLPRFLRENEYEFSKLSD